MGLCDGRVAIVTGAGRGLGRATALMLANDGAKVVVNDLGSAKDGEGRDSSPAEQVVGEIREAGGHAVANGGDVADWASAEQMISQAVDTYGRLDVLVNNAGILRDKMLWNISEDDFDSVIRVNLKGTFAPLHHAANYWRLRSKAGDAVEARVINMTSSSGLFGNIGQANYAASKAGVAGMTIVAALELKRIGVMVNAVAPRAETRMTSGILEYTAEEMELRHPDYVAGLITWLASEESRGISGRCFEAWGGGYALLEGTTHGGQVAATRDRPDGLGDAIRGMVDAGAKPSYFNRGQYHDI